MLRTILPLLHVSQTNVKFYVQLKKKSYTGQDCRTRKSIVYRYYKAFGFEIVKVVLDHKDLEKKLEAAVKDAVTHENERLFAQDGNV